MSKSRIAQTVRVNKEAYEKIKAQSEKTGIPLSKILSDIIMKEPSLSEDSIYVKPEQLCEKCRVKFKEQFQEKFKEIPGPKSERGNRSKIGELLGLIGFFILLGHMGDKGKKKQQPPYVGNAQWPSWVINKRDLV